VEPLGILNEMSSLTSQKTGVPELSPSGNSIVFNTVLSSVDTVPARDRQTDVQECSGM